MTDPVNKEDLPMLESLKKMIPKDKTGQVVWLSMIALAFLAGWIISNGEPTSDIARHEHEKEETATSWTCSMHPQIQQPKPGQCPI
jgi:Cu(I)/Ag(I) efflux system membrane fusion protein